MSMLLAACGSAGEDDRPSAGTPSTAHGPTAQASVDSASSTQPGTARTTGLVAKRLGALECGARIQTRHSDHRAAFGTSIRARMQMPGDCVPTASARVRAKVLEDPS